MRRIALLAFFFSVLAAPEALADDLVVVELFSSQGCDMCPPANRLLSDLASENNVLTLTWHVDYWDYLGWKDTMAKPEFTARQEGYNKALGRKGVYTPQIIINGRHQVLGSNKLDLYQTIQSAVIANELPMTVRFERSGEGLGVRVGGPDNFKGAVISLIWVDNLETVKIAAGGNAGKTISYVTIVRQLDRLGSWSGTTVVLPVNIYGPARDKTDLLVVLVQDGESGPVIGAAKIQLDSFTD